MTVVIFSFMGSEMLGGPLEKSAEPVKAVKTATNSVVLTAFTGSADSPAATATISDPINENITTVIPSNTELIPFGINPP